MLTPLLPYSLSRLCKRVGPGSALRSARGDAAVMGKAVRPSTDGSVNRSAASHLVIPAQAGIQ